MPEERQAASLSLHERQEATPASDHPRDAAERIAPGGRRLDWGPTLRLAAALTTALGALGIVYLLAKPLALLVLAVTLAESLSPFADRLEAHMRRGLAVALIYVTLFAAVGLLGWLVVPLIVSEGQQFLQTLPDMLDDAQRWFHRTAGSGAGRVGREAVSSLAGAAGSLLAVPLEGVSRVFDFLVVVFLSLYFLIGGPKFKTFVLSLFPPRQRRRARRLLERMGRSMGGYVRGSVLDGLLVAALTWLALTVVGLDYALVLAVLMFFGELIPFLGPVIAAVPAVLVALVESPGKAVTVALIYLAIEQLEGHIIAPNIMHSQTDISPALVIFALACGFAAGGLIGALVAIPLFAAGQVLTLSLLAPLVRRWSSRRRTSPS